MRVRDYLKDKWGLCLLLMGSSTYVGIIFNLYSVHRFIAINFFLLFYLLLVGWLTWDFWKRRHFYNRLQQLQEQLDEKYLLSELGPVATFAEGVVSRDILGASHKSMKEQVNAYAFAMEEYQEYLEMWVHEVKTPLASARLLLENYPNQVSRSIDEELDQVEKYVQQVLFYARSSYVEKDFLVKEISLQRVVQTALKKHVKDFAVKRIQLDFQPIVRYVYSDQKWLLFMLHQIIDNAVKYVEVNGLITISSTEEAQHVTLSIADTGKGIPSQDLPRIFEKGFTGENGRKYGKSTGIGLYLCQKMAKQLGIQLKATSQVGAGTVVTLVFPLSDMHFLKDKE